jgi:hypothetical protein
MFESFATAFLMGFGAVVGAGLAGAIILAIFIRVSE